MTQNYLTIIIAIFGEVSLLKSQERGKGTWN